MVCLDANIVLELLLERQLAQKCQDFISSTKDEIAITTLSVSIIMYYAEAKGIDLQAVEKFLYEFVWLNATERDVAWAFQNYAGKDFEDALQIATANREGCKKFVTLDKSLAKKYTHTLPIELIR